MIRWLLAAVVVVAVAAGVVVATQTGGGSSLPCDPSKDASAHCILRGQPAPKQLRAIPTPSAPLRYGLDGWGPPALSTIISGGYAFGVAYLSYDPSKNWTRAAVAAYQRAGKGTVAVWETSQYRPLSGYAGGQSDAREASRQAAALGNKTGPIDFAVDFDAACSQILSYFRGLHSILGARTGIYGGYNQVLCVKRAGQVGNENWQTYAWSGGAWLPASIAPLEQYLNGNQYDHDRALAADYGQWFPRAAQPATDPFRVMDTTRRHFHRPAPSPVWGAATVVVASEHGTMTTIRRAGCHGKPRRAVCKSSKFHLTLLRGRLVRVATREHPHYRIKGQGARQTIMAKQLARLS